MLQHNRFIGFIMDFVKWVKFIFLNLFENNHPVCRIEEINIDKKTIVIYSRGISAPIKFRFDEIINDVIVVSNLSSQQASWVGYYFGLNYESYIKDNIHFDYDSQNLNFINNSLSSRYKLILQDRTGNIIYRDKLTSQSFVRSPIGVITCFDLINNFHPTDACYLGILAGISISKKRNGAARINHNLKKNLQVIK